MVRTYASFQRQTPLLSQILYYLLASFNEIKGPVCMVSDTRDNPPPELPWANFSLKSLEDSTNRLYDPARVVSGARQLGWASCLVSAGRVTLPGRKTFSHINTGSPTRDNSRRVKSHVFSKFRVLKHTFTLQKQNKLNKAHTDQMNERN